MATTKKPCSKRVVRTRTDAAIFSFLRSIDSPKSLAVWLMYAYGEHDQLTQVATNPSHYIDMARFRDDYAASSLLSKASFLKTSFDREQVALEKFSKAEDKCRLVNQALWPFSTADFKSPEELHPWISKVRSKIKSFLGAFDVEEMVDSCDWGPGVTTLLKGPMSVIPNKYQQETGMTQEAYDVMWPLLSESYPGWWNEVLSVLGPTICPGNVVITVPKNSKTDRVIAVEPGINLWFQKGIGAMLRKRLLRRGCNLNDQRINQRLSSLAQALGLATVDFSAASDTIAYECVRLLLPDEWFRVLRLFRCKFGVLPDGSQVRWQKFSSMGNGFTFELESMIFYAVALVATEELEPSLLDRVSVYGDDVILPASCYTEYRRLMELLGFTINPDKSFSSGPFYESCGYHYFDGHDVSPFYQKNLLGSTADCFSMHNRVVEYAHLCVHNFGLDARFRETVKLLRGYVSPDEFNLVPLQFGDVGFFSNLDQAMALKTTTAKRMIGWKIRISSEEPVTLPFDGYGLILAQVRSASCNWGERSCLFDSLKKSWRGFGPPNQRTPEAIKNKVPLKSSTVRKPRYTTVGYGQWYDLGRWFS